MALKNNIKIIMSKIYYILQMNLTILFFFIIFLGSFYVN